MVYALLLVAVAAVCSAMPLNLALAPNPTGKNWAVLVAGSNSWGNYRHQVETASFSAHTFQADICHSYQVLVNHGFDKEKYVHFRPSISLTASL